MFSALDGAELVDVFHPMANAAESPTLFALGGQEMLDIEQMVDETDRWLVGVMHSHTTTSPYPSPTDIADSSVFDPSGMLRHVIVSLRHAEPVLRCFTIAAGEVHEVPVVVAEAEDHADDEGGSVAIAAVMHLPQ